MHLTGRAMFIWYLGRDSKRLRPAGWKQHPEGAGWRIFAKKGKKESRDLETRIRPAKKEKKSAPGRPRADR